ncbi:muscle M-line assembly protein unc-89-like isoform X4 [Mya arenaria]|uniref:muscle M-line assembly protein unc-89-like isoform X4 n=1 Tax=Mya arenaria TaxID=6604 RepID=UPI0022E167F0|nr:muscle M-line assembly protein unc-89-like isoform X4 [Mya arenaria]
MMSSLVPGSIFSASGFNRKSTPTPPNVTPAELDNRYKRTNFNGTEWPYDSPVARAYDVSNTSTKLIILNNKYGKNSTRLRGYYTGPKKPDRYVDPERHRAKSPRFHPEWHDRCLDSSSPKFEPTVRSHLEWVNSSERPPNALIGNRLIAKSSVNRNRHAMCRSTPTYDPETRAVSRISMPPSKYFSDFSEMSAGEKLYLWSIERIYSMDRMKQLKQDQYKKLLEMEAKKDDLERGKYEPGEYKRYMRYINSAKDRTYGTGSPSDRRARSAYSSRSKSATSSRVSTAKQESRQDEQEKTESQQQQQERPKTSRGQTRQEQTSETKTEQKPKEEETRQANADQKPSRPKSPYGSPSPSRRSSARSTSTRTRTPSQRSLRSKASSRASSASSAKHAGKAGDKEESEVAPVQRHIEGKDRPKSRLGHPHHDDIDKEDELLYQQIPNKDSTTSSASSDSEQTKTKKREEVDEIEQVKQNNKPAPVRNEKMGSKVSINSRASVTSKGSRKSTASAKQNASQSSQNDSNKTDDVKVHRVPSTGYIEGEVKTGVAKSDNKNLETDREEKRQSDANEQETDESKLAKAKLDGKVKFESEKEQKDQSVDNIDDGKAEDDTSEQKKEQSNKDESERMMNKTDDDKTDVDDERVRNKLNRQDSFDEADEDVEDRRVKDPDKLEY